MEGVGSVPTDMESFCGESANGSGNQKSINPIYGIYDRRLRQSLWHSRPQTPSRTGPVKLIRDRDPVTDPLP